MAGARMVMDWITSHLPIRDREAIDSMCSGESRLKRQIGAGIKYALLGQYLKRSSRDIVLGNGPYGKPFIQWPVEGVRLRFNMSYSEEWILMAVAWDRDLGIDVERWHELPFEDLVTSHFSPSEIQEWRSLPGRLRVEGFFNAWTRKEAYLKAVGTGLSRPLQSFSVNLDPRCPAGFVADGQDSERASNLRIHRFSVAENYSAALVVEGAAPTFVFAEMLLE